MESKSVWRAHGDPGIVGKYVDGRTFSPRPYGGYGCVRGSGDICCNGNGGGCREGRYSDGLTHPVGFGYGSDSGPGTGRGTGP